jgi:hypothetical protein
LALRLARSSVCSAWPARRAAADNWTIGLLELAGRGALPAEQPSRRDAERQPSSAALLQSSSDRVILSENHDSRRDAAVAGRVGRARTAISDQGIRRLSVVDKLETCPTRF